MILTGTCPRRTLTHAVSNCLFIHGETLAMFANNFTGCFPAISLLDCSLEDKLRANGASFRSYHTEVLPDRISS